MSASVAILALFSAFARTARADDPALSRIDALYFHRDQDDHLARSLALIDAGVQDAGPDRAAYLWRRCRSLVGRGEKRVKKTDALSDYEAARKDCEAAVARSSASVDAHFWLGIAMGRWGETKGIWKAMFLVGPIRREMATVLKLDPRHGGAHRVLGEMLWHIPPFVGGDKKQALAEFEAAVRLSPDHAENYDPLAQAYLHFGRKGDALRALRAVEAITAPADPASYPDDLADARKQLATLSH